jgi:DNA-directed RNA polymerase specialized sigma24 family protein
VLLAYTIWRARIYRWSGDGNHLLAQGLSAEDIVQRVIEKTLTGQRKWDPNKGELLPWLRDQVNSELDGLVKSAAHRYEMVLESDDSSGGDVRDKIEYRAVEDGILGSVRPPNPENLLIEGEGSDLVSALFQAVDGDLELEEVLNAVMDGCELKPRHLAEMLGVPKQNINNRLKRLRRRVALVKDVQ